MKTAISIPDPVFEQAERFARKTGLSRSKLYAMAVREYIEAHRGGRITQKLNEVYARNTSSLSPGAEKLQAETLAREDW